MEDSKREGNGREKEYEGILRELEREIERVKYL